MIFFNTHCTYEKFKSGFHAHNSRETTLVRVVNDLRINADWNPLFIVVLLDLSTTFDMTDRSFQLERLQKLIGLTG